MIHSPATDLKTRKILAWSHFWDMKNVWASSELPVELNVCIFQATCCSVLLYGCETWQLTKDMTRQLDSYATSCYRFMLGIKRVDRVQNTRILQLVSQEPLSTTVQRRQLRWLGHTLRRPPGTLSRRYVLYNPDHGHRRRGRPRLLYTKYIQPLTGVTNLANLDERERERMTNEPDNLHSLQS